VCGEQTLSYGELNRRANQLAHRLIAEGVGPDDLVGICVERNVEMIVGLLGVLKAGGAYVPLDPGYPPDRLSYMLADSSPKAMLTQTSLLPSLHDWIGAQVVLDDVEEVDRLSRLPDHNPDAARRGLTSSHLAYIIYTSGSTGAPKGVMVEHRQVVRLFGATDHWFHFGEQDVWSLFHSFAFDFSVWEIWGALAHGGKLLIVPKDIARSPDQFYQLLCEQKVTVLNQTPSAFRQLIGAQARSSQAHHLRYVVFGGEALETSMLAPWYARHVDHGPLLINMYGITETTVHVTYRPLSAEDVNRRGASPIGVKIPDLSVYILDANRQLAPLGVAGELYIGGAGV
ncbi:amino acid adenylation domain-containing protein, partial [Chromobacterium violaceum]